MTIEDANTMGLLIQMWPILLALLMLAAAWGGMIVRMRKIEQAQRERKVWQKNHEDRIDAIREEIKHRLYGADHEPLFVTVSRCERTHVTMASSITDLITSHKTLAELIHRHVGEHDKG